MKEAEQLVEACRQLGTKSVVITSAYVSDHDCVIGYDHLNDDFFIINFEKLDISFPGTGDIFSGVLICDYLNHESLHDATCHAMNVVSDLIKENINKEERFYGVDIEKYISEGKL